MQKLQKASPQQTTLGAFGAGNVVKLDGGKRIRLDDKVDFWPATQSWQVLETGETGQGMTLMLAFLTEARETAGEPITKAVPIQSDLKITCDHCGKPARLHLGKDVYPGREDLKGLYFWVCWRCDAWVGTHRDDLQHRPLGGLAKEELRNARRAAHEAFDAIWEQGLKTRSEAHHWLSRVTGIPEFRCHIGMMDVDECRRVADVAAALMFGAER